ncbi:hypothetical protein SAV31267_094750 [Streptomyces avermitilis]|uniref:Uncharacterized protein n=1 Tax=Streptomyces avermitilis TaxID=33903 RepID=A0A4D4N6F9_STRAX|nr:hypothetical protein SAV31267_094750 [Streptomyces avermitilis]
MRFETTGVRGVSKRRPPTTRAKSSSTGSMSGEWNAWLTVSREILRPSRAKKSATAATASSVPETTTDCGPLIAAMPASSVRCGSTSSSVAWTAIIAPPAGRACISAARAVTSAAASSSARAPATCAAAISPTECPAR